VAAAICSTVAPLGRLSRSIIKACLVPARGLGLSAGKAFLERRSPGKPAISGPNAVEQKRVTVREDVKESCGKCEQIVCRGHGLSFPQVGRSIRRRARRCHDLTDFCYKVVVNQRHHRAFNNHVPRAYVTVHESNLVKFRKRTAEVADPRQKPCLDIGLSQLLRIKLEDASIIAKRCALDPFEEREGSIRLPVHSRRINLCEISVLGMGARQFVRSKCLRSDFLIRNYFGDIGPKPLTRGGLELLNLESLAGTASPESTQHAVVVPINLNDCFLDPCLSYCLSLQCLARRSRGLSADLDEKIRYLHQAGTFSGICCGS
jgi:hypothetical protein